MAAPPTPESPLDETQRFSQRYTTWVKSSLIPRFRDDAPSLEELCNGLIGTLDRNAGKEKPSQTPATAPADTKAQNGASVAQGVEQRAASKAEPEAGPKDDDDQPRPNGRPALDGDFCEAFPDFESYAHLDALSEHTQPEKLRAIATKIKETQLRWMDEERVEATWVTPNILLDGILGSVDAQTLQALCATHGFQYVAMVSLHPDDWVAGAAWKAHGRLRWAKRPASAQERASGVDERLVAPLWDQQPARNPQIIVQNDVEYPSPVSDQLVIPLEDGDGSSLLMQLPDICTFIDQHTRPDVLVVVHCKVGLSRSNAAQEAFVLHAVHRELRKKAEWTERVAEQKQADLQTICKAYHKSLQQRRSALKSKFPNQMANWAKYLAEDAPACGPDFATDKTSPGGNDMRDAAITACYELGHLLPPNLISHYYKRTAAGTETAQKTIRRFRKIEQEMHSGVKGDVYQDTTSCLSLLQFVTLCQSTHK